MKNYKIAMGITLVAAAGVVTGLLFAPMKGRKMRRKIKNESSKLLDKAKTLFAAGENELEDVEEQSGSITA